MEEVREIITTTEQHHFKNLAFYCFPLRKGWLDQLFPLVSGDTCWGVFKGKELACGAVIKNYMANIYSSLECMAGISVVGTAPQYRNRGYVSKLFSFILKRERSKGKIFSSLRPFKFKFYEKYGYGYLGYTLNCTFLPKNIRTLPKPKGIFLPFSFEEKQLKHLYDINDNWIKKYNFGILSRRLDVNVFGDQLKWSRDYIMLYYSEGDCTGYIRYHLHPRENEYFELEIIKTCWKNPEAFCAIFYFLWTHRDQCRKIVWKSPSNVPLHMMLENTPFSQTFFHEYMVRPLDVKRILDLKASINPSRENITFAIEDPVLPDNTGNYSVEGTCVNKKPYNNEKAIPLHIFSSLLFGGNSFEQTILAGQLTGDFSEAVLKFFCKDSNIFISELF